MKYIHVKIKDEQHEQLLIEAHKRTLKKGDRVSIKEIVLEALKEVGIIE